MAFALITYLQVALSFLPGDRRRSKESLEQQHDNSICNHKAAKTLVTLDICIQNKFLSVSSASDRFLIKRSFSSSSLCIEACLHDADAKEIPV